MESLTKRCSRCKRELPVEEQYEALTQSGLCAICNTPPITWINIDHSHSNGNTRGALCFRCNSMLGYFKDNPETIRRAIEYLKSNDYSPTPHPAPEAETA